MSRVLLLCGCILLGVLQAYAGLTTQSRRKTYVAGEVFTAADKNADEDARVAFDNLVVAYFPGDSLKVIIGAIDTLVSRSLGKIVVKVPLVSSDYTDSLDYHRIAVERARFDSAYWGNAPATPSFALGTTAGKRARLVYIDNDTTLSDSTRATALAATRAWLTNLWLNGSGPIVGFSAGTTPGTRVRWVYADVDTLVGGTIVPPGSRVTAAYVDVDTLANAVRATGLVTAAAGVTVPAGQSLTAAFGDLDTLAGGTIVPNGVRLTAGAVDADSLIGAVRLTGLSTHAAGLTVPAGQSLGAASADVDTLTGGTVIVPGQRVTAAYIDADTLAGAVRLTGAATLAGGGTLPVGQTLTGTAGSIIDVTAITPDSILGTTRLTGAATFAGGATVPAGVTITGSAGSLFDLTAVTPDSILGNVKLTGTPVFSSGFSALLANINSGTIDGATIGGAAAGAGTFTTLTASGVLSANDTLDISTAAKWQLANVAYTGTMANLNTLRDDSMADALHRHSELSASDGDPNAALALTAVGDVSIGSTRLFVGTATASANAAGPSLLIAQGANDDLAFMLTSSDVAHGITTYVQTDAYFTLVKVHATDGGIEITGYSEAVEGMTLRGLAWTDNTTHTTAALGYVNVVAGKKVSTYTGAAGADANLLVVRNSADAQFIVDAEGDLFANGSDVTVYDDYDDVQMVRALDLATNSDQLIRSQWDEYVLYNEDDLVKAGILGAPRSEGGLVCVTQLQRLHNGAIWQSAQHIYSLEEWRDTDVDPRISALERRIGDIQMQLAWRELMDTVEGM